MNPFLCVAGLIAINRLVFVQLPGAVRLLRQRSRNIDVPVDYGRFSKYNPGKTGAAP
jgi:hypothetical protein